MAPITLSVPRAALAPTFLAFSIYNALLLVGLFGLLAVLAAVALSPSVHRCAAWTNLYITAVLYASSYLLLFFAGHGVDSPPPFDLCLAQASLTYAVCTLCSCAALVLSITMWMGVCRPKDHEGARRVKIWGIIIPWVLWLAVLLLSVGVGLADRKGIRVTRSVYCMIVDRVPAQTSEATVALTFVVNIVFQALTFRGLWQHKSAEDEHHSLRGIAIRMLLWNTTTIVEVVLIYALLNEPSSDSRVCLVQASLPLLAFAAFGTRKDIFLAWLPCFARRVSFKELT